MRRAPITASAVVLLATAGCYASSVLPSRVPEQGVVRVRFDPPQALDAAAPGRDTWRLDGVTEVEGRVLSARGETLHVELTRVLLAERSSVVVHGRSAVVVPQRARPAELRELSLGRTFAAVVLPPVIAVALLTIYFTCCWDP